MGIFYRKEKFEPGDVTANASFFSKIKQTIIAFKSYLIIICKTIDYIFIVAD